MSRIVKPIIIIGCPRSGTSLLFRLLSTSRYLWSTYRESNDIWDRFYKLSNIKFENDVLSDTNLTEELKTFLLNEFHKHSLKNYFLGYLIREYFMKRRGLNFLTEVTSNINSTYKNLFVGDYKIVEKSPRNCFRISFINKLFDECKFIFLKRNGKTNINSLIEGWLAEDKYLRETELKVNLKIKGYNGNSWKFVMPPGWENYIEKPLEEVCAFQWINSNKAILDGLKSIEEERKYTVSYEELTHDTYITMRRICSFIHIPFSTELRKISKKPLMVNFVTKPQEDKWKTNKELIERIYPLIVPMMKELEYRI